MFVAQKLRKDNIAEYLIYMWQIEDMVRAFNLDIDLVKKNYLSHFTQWNDQQRAEALVWYQDIINMMRSENITDKGHLQICKNVIANLTELHQDIMTSSNFQYYHAAYNQALPLIVELRSHQPQSCQTNEIESCFELIYGIMLLKMKKQAISQDTLQASQTISAFLGMLSNYYHENLKEPLKL